MNPRQFGTRCKAALEADPIMDLVKEGLVSCWRHNPYCPAPSRWLSKTNIGISV
jgi:hypothetical protein